MDGIKLFFFFFTHYWNQSCVFFLNDEQGQINTFLHTILLNKIQSKSCTFWYLMNIIHSYCINQQRNKGFISLHLQEPWSKLLCWDLLLQQIFTTALYFMLHCLIWTVNKIPPCINVRKRLQQSWSSSAGSVNFTLLFAWLACDGIPTEKVPQHFMLYCIQSVHFI